MLNISSELKNAIREGIINSFVQMKEDAIALFNYRNKHKVGDIIKTEKTNPRTVLVEYTDNNGKTRRRWETKYDIVTTYYTQEMYDAELAERIKQNDTHSLALKICPDDSVRNIHISDTENPTDEDIENVYNCYIISGWDAHLIGLTVHTVNYYGGKSPKTYSCTYPVFDGDYNEEFKNQYDSFCARKAAWCAKYGCD